MSNLFRDQTNIGDTYPEGPQASQLVLEMSIPFEWITKGLVRKTPSWRRPFCNGRNGTTSGVEFVTKFDDGSDARGKRPR